MKLIYLVARTPILRPELIEVLDDPETGAKIAYNRPEEAMKDLGPGYIWHTVADNNGIPQWRTADDSYAYTIFQVDTDTVPSREVPRPNAPTSYFVH